jgi:glycerophosphoryl diester phosphodiesterase
MLIIAHRGASVEAVENTGSAFVAALRTGAQLLETDLHLTRDGHLVIHHDPTTGRLMGLNRTIALTPLAELRTLRYANGDGLLTLVELLTLVGGRLPVNLELKGRETGAALASFLAGHPYPGGILVSSQHWEELAAVRQGEMPLPVGPVVDMPDATTWKRLERMDCRFMSLNHRAFTLEVVRRLHAAGLQLYLYTVNTPGAMVHFAAADVDGIFTDDPALAVRVLHALGNALPPEDGSAI